MVMSRVSEIVKEESTRQTIILAFSLAGTIGMFYLARHMDEPEFGRELKMKTALYVKRFANNRADFWGHVAAKAATVYNREKA